METFICKKTSFHTVWEGMSRFSGLCDAFLFFTFKLGRYRHHTKPGQATLNQIELRSVATCRMKVLRSVSRNYRDGLSGPANVFLRVIIASEVWMVSILNYLDKMFRDQLGLLLLDRLNPAQDTWDWTLLIILLFVRVFFYTTEKIAGSRSLSTRTRTNKKWLRNTNFVIGPFTG